MAAKASSKARAACESSLAAQSSIVAALSAELEEIRSARAKSRAPPEEWFVERECLSVELTAARQALQIKALEFDDLAALVDACAARAGNDLDELEIEMKVINMLRPIITDDEEYEIRKMK